MLSYLKERKATVASIILVASVAAAWFLTTRDGMPAWRIRIKARTDKKVEPDYKSVRNGEPVCAMMMADGEFWEATEKRWRLVLPKAMLKMRNAWKVKSDIFAETQERPPPGFRLVFNGKLLRKSHEGWRKLSAAIPPELQKSEGNVLELWADEPNVLRTLHVKNYASLYSWFPTVCTVRLKGPYCRAPDELGIGVLVVVLLLGTVAALWLNRICLRRVGAPIWTPRQWVYTAILPIVIAVGLSVMNLAASTKVIFAQWSAVLLLVGYLSAAGAWCAWRNFVAARWEGLTEEKRDRWRERRCVVLLFVIFWVIYNSNMARVGEIDGEPAPRMAISLVRHGDLNLDEYPELRKQKHLKDWPIVETINGHWVSRWTPGSALWTVPFVAVPAALGLDETPSTTIPLLGKLSGSMITALSAVFVYLCLKRITSRRGALWLTVAYALGTASFSVSSQDAWQHAPVQLCLAVALYVLLSDRKGAGWHLLVGMCLGSVVLCRPLALILTVPIGLWGAQRHGLKVWVWYALGALPFGLFLAGYDDYYSGTPGLFGYEGLVGEGWMPGYMPKAFAGLFIAPNRGLFVYSPFLLVVPYCAWRGLRRPERRYGWLVAFCIGAVLAHFLVVSAWKSWHALLSFGSRYSADALVYWALLGAFGIESILAGRLLRRVFAALVVLSIFIQSLGVYVSVHEWNWYQQRRPSVDGEHFTSAAWDLQQPQILWQVKRLLGIGVADDPRTREP